MERYSSRRQSGNNNDINNDKLAIENENLEGPVNAVAPNLVTNYEYTKTIQTTLGKGLILRIPTFVFKIVFGEMSQIILNGTKINSKLHDGSFKFEYPELSLALKDLLK